MLPDIGPIPPLRQSHVVRQFIRIARYEILTANMRKEAEEIARPNGFLVLEVVPRWSFPAKERTDGNREMWKSRPK